MTRRRLLQGIAAAALARAALRAAHASPAESAPIARRLAANPLYTPFLGVTDGAGETSGNRHTPEVQLLGRWPSELRGRFYRNGPALFDRGGQRYHHWFDGDGMVQQFTLTGTRVSHRGRLVQTAKLKAEREAGRFLYSALGTQVEGAAPITGPDSVNPANTNALEHGGRLLAMWEGGSAHALDPSDLSTLGPVAWRKDLAGLPFTAHPKVDADGQLWNIGTMGRHLMAWQVGPEGALRRFQPGESPYPGGMVHDMAVTRRYLVVPLPPVKLDFGRPMGEGPRRFALEAGQPLRLLVMDKADITRRRVFELPAEMVFHVGDAFEEADGTVVLSYVGAPDAWFLDRGAVALMAGQPAPAGRTELKVARLDMASGKSSVQSLTAGEVEFPRIDPRRIGLDGAQAANWLLTGAAWRQFAGRDGALLHGVQLAHLKTGRVQRFDYGEHAVAEEHVLVPKPGRSGELDAWVLGTCFDARRQATVLNVLDAADIAGGPIAQAVLPYVLPLGFHGNFTAA